MRAYEFMNPKKSVSESFSNTTFNVDRRKLNEGRAEAPFTALDAVKSILGARNITTDKNNLGYNQFYIRDVTPGSSFHVTSKDKQEYPYIFRGGEVRRNIFSYFQPMNKNARNDTGGIAVLQFPFNSKDALDVGAAVHEAYHARIYKSQQQQNKKTHGNEQLVNNMAEKWLRKNLTGFVLHTALEAITSSRISYGVAEDTVDEMTQRTGKLNNKMSQNFVDKNKELWYKSPIIGQIEEYDLRKYNEMYSLWNNSDYVASAMLKDINDSGISDTGLFHVAIEYRGQKILSKLLWNFKTRQNRSILRIDPYHSDDLYDIVYGSGLSRFKKYWMDNNGNIEPYDKSTVNKYYSYLGKTNWQLILENNYNYSDMPHFSEGKNWITEDYSWQII